MSGKKRENVGLLIDSIIDVSGKGKTQDWWGVIMVGTANEKMRSNVL